MKEVERAEQILQCASCGWDQFCIKPPAMTSEEVKAKLQEHRDDEDRDRAVSDTLINAIAYAGKDTTCPACPKFIERLRADGTLALKMKEWMRGAA